MAQPITDPHAELAYLKAANDYIKHASSCSTCASRKAAYLQVQDCIADYIRLVQAIVGPDAPTLSKADLLPRPKAPGAG